MQREDRSRSPDDNSPQRASRKDPGLNENHFKVPPFRTKRKEGNGFKIRPIPDDSLTMKHETHVRNL